MALPLQLSDDEMSVLMRLAEPIDPTLRPQFLEAVAQELEANGQAGAVGAGALHRAARNLQRKYFDPPQLPNSSPREGHERRRKRRA